MHVKLPVRTSKPPAALVPSRGQAVPGEKSARSGGTSTLDSKRGVTRVWLLASFVALAYAVSWGWTFPLVAIGDVIEKGVGWPTSFPALLGPALAASVVTALV